jgi:hypothetical protein
MKHERIFWNNTEEMISYSYIINTTVYQIESRTPDFLDTK